MYTKLRLSYHVDSVHLSVCETVIEVHAPHNKISRNPTSDRIGPHNTKSKATHLHLGLFILVDYL